VHKDKILHIMTLNTWCDQCRRGRLGLLAEVDSASVVHTWN